jgi:aldose 1-epimerase
MAATLSLRNEGLHCQIWPALGGSITGLWLDDLPVLRTTTLADMQSALDAASYPLVPYSNRIAQARLGWAGQTYELRKNFLPEPHAIHGCGWEQAWDVLDCDDQFAVLGLEHEADRAWPFDFSGRQTMRVHPDRLELQMQFTNLAVVAVPAGLGWHPYFTKRPGCRIAFDATGRWEMGRDQLPTHLAAHAGVHADGNTLRLDHCFDGWSGALEWRDSVLDVRVTSNLSRLVVYTTPERNCIAIEPVSHVNNALARIAELGESMQDLGVRVLQPGESTTAAMTIEVRAASA